MVKFQIPFFKKAKAKGGLTCLALTDDGVAFAHVVDDSGSPVLEACDFFETVEPLSSLEPLSDIVSRLNIQGSETVIVLPQTSYQLLLVDSPDVPEEEVKEALRWRVKDLVSFDILSAKIDYVELPSDAYRGRSKMTYAVVAEEGYLQRLSEFVTDLGLLPVAIDIPELALLNVMSPMASEETGHAVFFTSSPSSSINLLSGNALYFTRSLSYDVKQAVFNPSMTAAASVLELQRSLDYYESQVGKPPCVKLHVLPTQEKDSPLLHELSEGLPLEVVSEPLSELVTVKSGLNLSHTLQHQALIAIFGAHRLNVKE